MSSGQEGGEEGERILILGVEEICDINLEKNLD